MEAKRSQKSTCGLVMPISAIDDCSEKHWEEVRSILESVILETGMDCKLVSDETDVGVIHKRIVQNLYENELVICDVSCRNPNVMFELGMRLAFDKPFIIIKDDLTPYSFDTSPVEHLTYRRDLRFNSVNEFKSRLKNKIDAVIGSKHKSSFLSSFGPLKAAEIQQEKVEPYELLLEEMSLIRRQVSALSRGQGYLGSTSSVLQGRRNIEVTSMRFGHNDETIEIDALGSSEEIEHFFKAMTALVGIDSYNIKVDGNGRHLGTIIIDPNANKEYIFNYLLKTIKPNSFNLK